MRRDDFPIEGDFIEDIYGNIFEIKGFHQPKNEIIGFIRYKTVIKQEILDNSRYRTRKDLYSGKNSYEENKKEYYQKIYDLKKKFDFIEKNYPDYIKIYDNLYFPVHAIPITKIKRYFQPNNVLKEYLHTKKDNLTNLGQISVKFCEILSTKSNVDIKYFGITGSVALGLDDNKSDIDIIVYGFENSVKVRNTIKKKFLEKLEKSNPIRKYNLEELEKLYHFRAKNLPITFSQFQSFEQNKLHQGYFHNHEFFIRYFTHLKHSDYAKFNQFYLRKISKLGRIQCQGKVTDDQFSWSTPSLLNIQIEKIQFFSLHNNSKNNKSFNINHKLGEITQLFSLRGRFTENLITNQKFELLGTLELITHKDKNQLFQIALGSNTKDYLVKL